mmetsp:Transcript_13448/g.26389  ORF Transcript_13448/g.26389 Transcript_13448/m.26389 type:complete len:237 (+) Transcript_13448:757-1467(+)
MRHKRSSFMLLSTCTIASTTSPNARSATSAAAPGPNPALPASSAKPPWRKKSRTSAATAATCSSRPMTSNAVSSIAESVGSHLLLVSANHSPSQPNSLRIAKAPSSAVTACHGKLSASLIRSSSLIACAESTTRQIAESRMAFIHLNMSEEAPANKQSWSSVVSLSGGMVSCLFTSSSVPPKEAYAKYRDRRSPTAPIPCSILRMNTPSRSSNDAQSCGFPRSILEASAHQPCICS